MKIEYADQYFEKYSDDWDFIYVSNTWLGESETAFATSWISIKCNFSCENFSLPNWFKAFNVEFNLDFSIECKPIFSLF